jgi:RNA-directed DNA polymerase
VTAKRQKIQLELAFGTVATGEARSADQEGTEVGTAASRPETPAASGPLMEAVVERDNLRKALAQVRRNKGAPGVDGMTVDELAPYRRDHWPAIRTQLLEGTYRPQPVLRVEIPKAGGGDGMRALGIPTVLDRFIQQAVLQVLQPRWDPTFSDASFGFRPGRSAHQAVARAQAYIAEGYACVVDLDLEKFFDRVDQDLLMGLVAKRVGDRRLLRLIRGFLNAGVLAEGLVGPTDEGVPPVDCVDIPPGDRPLADGGPLSPLLSNLMLDVLDQELVRRGHRFVRYADDCNIYVRSRRAGERVMASVARFVTTRLKLRVNATKSAVDQPSRRKFLGFSFTPGKEPPRRRVAPQALARFKERARELTRRARGISLQQMVEDLRVYLVGWLGYFGYCQTPTVLRMLEQWIRRRLRAVAWMQWRNGWNRFDQLSKRGVPRRLAAQTASSAHGPWRIAASPALNIALSNKTLAALGLPPMVPKIA